MKNSTISLFGKKEILIILGFFIAFVTLGYFTFFTSNHFDKSAPFTFEIRDGETFSSVTERLYEQAIIPGKFNFKVAALFIRR